MYRHQCASIGSRSRACRLRVWCIIQGGAGKGHVKACACESVSSPYTGHQQLQDLNRSGELPCVRLGRQGAQDRRLKADTPHVATGAVPRLLAATMPHCPLGLARLCRITAESACCAPLHGSRRDTVCLPSLTKPCPRANRDHAHAGPRQTTSPERRDSNYTGVPSAHSAAPWPSRPAARSSAPQSALARTRVLRPIPKRGQCACR